MTQTVTKDGITILVDLPEHEKKEHRHVQPSYVKACQGDEGMASILDYFTYAASREIKDKGLSKDCKVVTLTRTHDAILDKLENAPSEKSLIRYLKKLKGCKFVLSEKYKRDFEVHLDTIQEAVNNPPPPKTRKPRQKGCKVELLTGVQPSEEESEKVVRLQHKVDMLQQKVEQLQPFVDMLQRYNPVLEALGALLEGTQNDASLVYTSILPLVTSNSDVDANAIDTTPLSFPILDSGVEAVTDETFKIAVLDDWREYKHLPRFTPTIDVMSEALKRLQRASGYRISQDETPSQPSPVSAAPGEITDNPCTRQPMDDIPSQARDNGVREATPPLSNPERVNPSRPENSALNASTDTLPPASEQRRIASTTRKDAPAQETHADGETPTGSGASETGKKPNKPRTPRVTTPKPAPPVLVLSADEQAFYDLYCSLPMIKIKPDVTAKVKEQCGKLAPHLKTQEELFKLSGWMRKHHYFKDKGFNLPMVVNALNEWAMTQAPIDMEEKRNEARKDAMVNTGTSLTQVVRPKETELERHNRELRERFSSKKVVG